MARHTAKSHKIRKVEILVIQIGICRIRCSEKYTENRSFVGVLRIVTKTLQNGSRQLRTDRNLLRNSTDRPKNKACVTGSDSFRKRTNRTLSRSRERNPKTGTDNHNIENQHCRATCLAVLHISEHKKTPCKIFFALQGVLLNIRIIKYYNYCNPVIKITNDIIVITVQPMYLPAISQSDGSAFSTFRI